ncbi:MAG: hypothetical protein K2Q25_14540 [Mycobacteriaceae bacterium]|nr:hypothetical protein [Mycobacteriaceae bacterium]
MTSGEVVSTVRSAPIGENDAIPIGEVDSIMMHCISKLLEVLRVALRASAVASSVGIAQIALAPHGAGNSEEIQVRIATVVLDAVVAAGLIMQSCHDEGFSGSPAMRLLAFYAAVLGVFEMLELLNGFGPPDRGGEFAEGSATFSDDIYAILAQATPINWFREAAHKYITKNYI